MSKKFFFVVNPISASGKTKRIWNKIQEFLEKENFSFDYCFTNYISHATKITNEAIKDGFEKIIAVGGDGTLNEVLNGFWENNQKLNSASALGYIPSGTGEDFARTLSIEKLSVENQIKRILRADCVYIDICEARFQKGDSGFAIRRFINESSVGFGANVAEIVNHSPKFLGSKSSFLMGVLRSLFFLKNHKVSVKISGKEVYNGQALIIVLANGKYFGGNMLISPKSIIDDGFIELLIVKKMDRREVLANINSIYSGNHLNNPKVIALKCKNVSIESEEKVFLEMDGEPIGLLNADFKVLEKGIKFLM